MFSMKTCNFVGKCSRQEKNIYLCPFWLWPFNEPMRERDQCVNTWLSLRDNEDICAIRLIFFIQPFIQPNIHSVGEGVSSEPGVAGLWGPGGEAPQANQGNSPFYIPTSVWSSTTCLSGLKSVKVFSVVFSRRCLNSTFSSITTQYTT